MQLRLQEKVMDRRDILALYKWAVADCFRCAEIDTETTPLAEITPPSGHRYEVRVCERCLLDLEDEKRRHAERVGCEYEPGHLGQCER
ncbi:hypothetical protein ACIP69_18735 [Streptomyces hygroscopicus]|uniref:hypothetical protein n=1 Tax=Streptomyces hygroscopicus TaxID=1912 RepID=UPI0038112015